MNAEPQQPETMYFNAYDFMRVFGALITGNKQGPVVTTIINNLVVNFAIGLGIPKTALPAELLTPSIIQHCYAETIYGVPKHENPAYVAGETIVNLLSAERKGQSSQAYKDKVEEILCGMQGKTLAQLEDAGFTEINLTWPQFDSCVRRFVPTYQSAALPGKLAPTV